MLSADDVAAQSEGNDEVEEAEDVFDEGDESARRRAAQPDANVEGPDSEAGGQEAADAEDEGPWCAHAFSKTTSLHDDWLRRGPYLYDMDLHNYIRFIQREERPTGEKGGTIVGRGTHVSIPFRRP